MNKRGWYWLGEWQNDVQWKYVEIGPSECSYKEYFNQYNVCQSLSKAWMPLFLKKLDLV